MEEKKQGNSPEQQARLEKWAARLSEAKAAWEPWRQKMERWEALYGGSHEVAASGGIAARKSDNVRNIVYELVESQADSSIPLPKVTAIHEEDRELARKIEAFLRTEVTRLALETRNDAQERTVPIMGAGWWEVGWDPLGGTRCQPGALVVECRHPKMIIPQPGVYEPDQMDYLFECLPRSRRSLERTYGVDLKNAARENDEQADGMRGNEMLVQNIAFYKGDDGRVGRFSWVDDIVLEDMEDYRFDGDDGERVLPRDMTLKGPGGKSSLVHALTVHGEAVLDEKGQSVLGADGQPLMKRTLRRRALPRYRAKEYPLVLRRNVSREGYLLGASDVEQIADQQEALKKMGGKIQEKILKGGSYVTLPQGVGVETTDRELKIIRLKTPAEKALIDVLNIQPDVSKEMAAAGLCYDWAKSTLGITDSYQGKNDSTAQSGAAKQFAANQAAGRLQSKRVMKNAAYAALYEKMFHTMLSCADSPLCLRRETSAGGVEYGHLDPMELLRVDDAGELYWNDEFLFEVDNSATLANNRQNMWTETRTNFTGGAFGPPASTRAQIAYWTMLAKYDYPGAQDVKTMLEERLEEEKEAAHYEVPTV